MKATINYQEIKKPIESVTIELTPKEASIMQAVCMRIGGHPNGPRGLFNEISRVLREAEIEPLSNAAFEGHYQAIHFKM